MVTLQDPIGWELKTLIVDSRVIVLFFVFFVYVVEEKPQAEVAEEEEEEEQKNAGNLLDNLFKKTKTTPCLYWLPLSDEQV